MGLAAPALSMVADQGARKDAVVRGLVPSDLPVLGQTVGQLVDALYPQGRKKLMRRLEDALADRAAATVVSSPVLPARPIALAAEVAKGRGARKLSTFWVAPAHRRRGIGRQLLASCVERWCADEVERVSVTVRLDRVLDLSALLGAAGFRHVLTDLDRYGEGCHEAVLEWRPDWSAC